MTCECAEWLITSAKALSLAKKAILACCLADWV